MAKKEVNTFSAAVDSVIARSGRPDRAADIHSYVRTSMRETQVQAWFWNDHVETQIDVDVDPYIWTPPIGFRAIQAVQYPALSDAHGRPISPHFVPPGKSFVEYTHFYYRSADYYTFAGIGLDGTSTTVPITLGYFRYFPQLRYYAEDNRPARYMYDDETGEEGWEYKTPGTEEENEAARNQVSNWLLFNWYELCIEGGLAKVFNTINDDRRQSSFSLFEKYKGMVRQGERSAIMESK